MWDLLEIRNARWALLRDRPDLILLDDAYQHLAVARDLNLLLVDAERALAIANSFHWVSCAT